MKFKVGDKVRIVKNNSNDFNLGEVVTVDIIDGGADYSIFCSNENNQEWVREEDIASLDYTWEDFKECPIGTKVTFEDGQQIVKYSENGFETAGCHRIIGDLEGFIDVDGVHGKIIKIEEPTYTTVYEPNEEVTMPEIEEMKRLTDELYKTYNEFIKKIKGK